MILFNKPPRTGNEQEYVIESLSSDKISGDGEFTKRCHKWFEEKLGCKKALLTTSCTHALEMAAILLNIKAGDEIIMPSYTFVSTANSFVLRGAKIVFVDIRPDTMNIDETKIEAAITDKTKVIVPVHYAGVGCEMDTIMDIALKYNLFVIEDAAQGMMSKYKDNYLGTIGHIGTYSFHETKNYTSAGEGGLLIINDERFCDRAEIIREKGTNRSLFFRGMVDKYSWVDIGSSYLPNDMSAAYLWGQLEKLVTSQKIESPPTDWQNAFDNSEKNKLMDALKKIEKYIKEAAKTTAEQHKVVIERLDYLTEALERLNRRDWADSAFSTVLQIMTQLALNPEQTKTIWNFITNAVGTIKLYLPFLSS